MPHHAASELYDLAGFRAGRDDIRPFELTELGPVVGVVRDGRTISQDIFEADYVRWDEPGGTYAAPDATFSHTATFERAHALSDVISAVLDVGLDIELFHEQSLTNVPWPWTIRGDDGFYRLPEGWPKYPLTYSLRARRSRDVGALT
ncbi:MAG TPA: hypothetical protein VFN21_05450 [Acidimicrobiales bacterium]|nr:hypothetical protein [Acidimicrobiales bacterium]